MKKLVLSALMCTLAVAAFATDFSHPGWKIADASKYDAMYEVAISQKNFSSAVCMAYLADFTKNGVPATFEEYKAVIAKNVDSVAKVLNITDKELIEKTKNQAICQSCYCRAEFQKEGYASCIEYNLPFYSGFFLTRATAIGLNNDELYVACRNWLMKFDYDSVNKHLVKIMINASLESNIDNATLKADLQKLNRKFSVKLIKNKAQYEPIVAEIRTVLETL